MLNRMHNNQLNSILNESIDFKMFPFPDELHMLLFDFDNDSTRATCTVIFFLIAIILMEIVLYLNDSINSLTILNNHINL